MLARHLWQHVQCRRHVGIRREWQLTRHSDTGCAWNAATGQPQPYVNLFDNGAYLLNVSVNGVPITQLSATHPHTPVFLSAGLNVISAANGTLSIDYYVRDGADGMCTLP